MVTLTQVKFAPHHHAPGAHVLYQSRPPEGNYMCDEIDREEWIKEQTEEARKVWLSTGAIELPLRPEIAQEHLRVSTSALTNLDPGFEFLTPPELGFGEEPNVLIEKITALPEAEPDLDPPVEIKLMTKQQAFSRLDPNFEAPIEYPFW